MRVIAVSQFKRVMWMVLAFNNICQHTFHERANDGVYCLRKVLKREWRALYWGRRHRLI